MVSHFIRAEMPCTPCELCFLLFITHYYHWPTLHVLHLLHLRDCVECVCVSVRLCASVWRNMVKCICICTRLSLSAMRANSLRQIKQSPFFGGRVKLARRMPLKKKREKKHRHALYGIQSSDIFVLFPFLSLCFAYPLLRKIHSHK